MFKFRKAVLVSIMCLLLVIVLYAFFKPMAFLLLTGIALSVIYFYLTVNIFLPNNASINRQSHVSTLSAILLAILFLLSIKVLHDYQRPGGPNPYFTNVDHYAIRNSGVVFNDNVELYSSEFDSSGFWNSNSGNLKVKVENKNVILQSNNFYTPIFSLKEGVSRLLNPVLEKPIRSGFKVSNETTSLVWNHISKEKAWFGQSDKYKMEILFSSKDPLIVGKSGLLVKDTFFIEATIKKGISLLNLLQKEQKSKGLNIESYVYNWLKKMGDIELIVFDENSGERNLYFQPTIDLIENNYTFNSNGYVNVRKKMEIDIPLNTEFYVGLSRSRYPLSIEKANESIYGEEFLNKFILKFGEQNLLPFYNIPGIDDFYSSAESENSKIGATKIRFLTNTIDIENTDNLKEGFVFQRNMKDNVETSITGIIEFQVDKPGVPLKWRSGLEKYQYGEGNFILKSKYGAYNWIVSVVDLSNNFFSFSIIKWYLLLVVLLMMVLVLYFPSPYALSVETPILILVYCFLVFRYLLTWRISTFPPLENIKVYELENTLRQFDNLIKGYPTSFTFIFILFALISLILYRGWNEIRQTKLGNLFYKLGIYKLFSTIQILFQNLVFKIVKVTKAKGIEFKFLIFIIICFVLNVINIDSFQRLIKIILPLSGYLIFVYKIIKNNYIYEYRKTKNQFLNNKVIPIVSKIIETPLSFVSFLILIYLGIFDTGFAVIFLIFTLFRFIIFNVLKYTFIPGVWRFKNDSRLIVFLGALAFLLILLFYKGAVHFIIRNDVWFVFLFSISLSGLLLILKTELKRIKLLSLVFLIFGFFSILPPISDILHNQIENKIRLTKYRAELIYKPMESVLFDNEFQSNQESKILETAQSQWFIHTYLRDAKFLDLFSFGKWIDFKPHFKVGVDYSTQTRDVVLPRYVIGEFGGFTMMLLLILCALPLVLYLFAYRIVKSPQRYLLADSSVGLLAVLMFFTISLMLWLTATNRFVFFGQDFPFLSITSKVSIIIPIFLLWIVLISKPPKLNRGEVSRSRRIIPGFGISIIVLLTIIMSKKSTKIQDKYFKADFTRVENNLTNHVDTILARVQSNMILPSFSLEDAPSEKRIVDIKKVIDALVNTESFKTFEKDSFSIYERSLWKMLKNDPSLGFRINSPIHFKINNERLYCVFNPYWSLELPPYNEKEVWKGDIEQDMSFNNMGTTSMEIKEFEGCTILTIPSNYLRTNQSLALLEIDARNKKDQFIVYNLKNRKIDSLSTGSYYKVINNSDIVIGLNQQKEIDLFSIDEKNKKYISRSILLNGKVQSIYPLKENLFWARHWAMATKSDFEKFRKNELNKNTNVTLDYELSKDVGVYLKRAFTNRSKSLGLKDAAFSIIAADGLGRIRLLSDYARERKLIDPNSEYEILDEQQNSYFYVDVPKERIQWGNLNLLRMMEGPGSTMKPLLAAAITSQKNAGWELLKYNHSNTPSDQDFKSGIKYYGGLKLKPYWKLEGNNVSIDGLQTYISKSNNLFHSIVVFLGYYNKEDFNSRGGNLRGLLQPITAINDEKSFPIITNAGTEYSFLNIKDWPKNKKSTVNFSSNMSLINLGLQNLELSTQANNLKGVLNTKENFSELNDSISNINTWAFPEFSYMLQSKRIVSDRLQDNFNSAVRQTSLGSGGVMDLTPFKMVEMYGKMITQNSRFKLTIDKPRIVNNPWNVDFSWNGNYSSFLYDNILEGMAAALTTGTAQKLGEILRQKYSGYKFYAKTGTIGSESKEEKNENSKRLALIITRDDIKQAVAKNQFYIVYFRFDKARLDGEVDKNFWELCGDLIGKILNSESFKNHMNK